ncbi:uroporphyrinogen-III synthase [Halopseudomonas sp.]|uniref:uroporphyrinogen-III synthase n=1 Tax=Halopseudomonas sp. TaxID=2901191 RepID=UPI00311F3250
MSGCLLLTRQAADNQRLAARFAAEGIETCSVPLLALEPCDEGPVERQRMLDLDRYHAVVVVSPTAARLGLERLDRYWPQPPVGIDWLAVGAGTAQVLRDYGLPAQCPEQGQDSEALLAMPLWQEHFARPDLRVLIWRGEDGREHLADQIRAVGGTVDYLPLYARRAPEDLAARLAEAASRVDRAVVLSVQALANWRVAAGADWERQRHWRCWVPSERIAAQAAAWGCTDVVTCRGADDAALVEAVLTGSSG